MADRISLGQPRSSSTADKVDWCVEALRSIERAINRFSVEKTADGFAVSNYVATRSFDAEAVTPMELADVVATFLDDIKNRGPTRR